MEFSSEKQAEQHYDGKNHKKKVKMVETVANDAT